MTQLRLFRRIQDPAGLRDRVRAYLTWTHQQPDACGECDRCHTDSDLWALPAELDDEPDAAWLFCAACYRRIVRRAAK